jgi:hypothetical protein
MASKNKRSVRTLTHDEAIQEMVDILAQGDGKFVEGILNQVFSVPVKYVGDSLFEQKVDEK